MRYMSGNLLFVRPTVRALAIPVARFFRVPIYAERVYLRREEDYIYICRPRTARGLSIRDNRANKIPLSDRFGRSEDASITRVSSTWQPRTVQIS